MKISFQSNGHYRKYFKVQQVVGILIYKFTNTTPRAGHEF